MAIQKFVLEYESDKPLLPVNRFRVNINPDCETPNLEALQHILKVISTTLNLTPIKK